MKTPITPEALIEMGFEEININRFTYFKERDTIEVYGDNFVDISVKGLLIPTNATTIEDIQDLIRLFE
jgi:hypothetical protein